MHLCSQEVGGFSSCPFSKFSSCARGESERASIPPSHSIGARIHHINGVFLECDQLAQSFHLFAFFTGHRNVSENVALCQAAPAHCLVPCAGEIIVSPAARVRVVKPESQMLKEAPLRLAANPPRRDLRVCRVTRTTDMRELEFVPLETEMR